MTHSYQYRLLCRNIAAELVKYMRWVNCMHLHLDASRPTRTNNVAYSGAKVSFASSDSNKVERYLFMARIPGLARFLTPPGRCERVLTFKTRTHLDLPRSTTEPSATCFANSGVSFPIRDGRHHVLRQAATRATGTTAHYLRVKPRHWFTGASMHGLVHTVPSAHYARTAARLLGGIA